MKTTTLLIPMAGDGVRFQEAYKQPKPLIDVKGKPMCIRAIESLDIEYEKLICIIRKDHNKNNILTKVLREYEPNAVIIEIDALTKGPACTALLAKPYIKEDNSLVIANCDQIMHWSGKRFMQYCSTDNIDGCVVTYHETTPKNSYARVDKYMNVLEIQEKNPISTNALNGIHWWWYAENFFQTAKCLIEDNETTNNEFYIAPTYNYLIQWGKNIKAYHIPNEQHIPIGVPQDLEKFYETL